MLLSCNCCIVSSNKNKIGKVSQIRGKIYSMNEFLVCVQIEKGLDTNLTVSLRIIIQEKWDPLLLGI